MVDIGQVTKSSIAKKFKKKCSFKSRTLVKIIHKHKNYTLLSYESSGYLFCTVILYAAGTNVPKKVKSVEKVLFEKKSVFGIRDFRKMYFYLKHVYTYGESSSEFSFLIVTRLAWLGLTP